MAEINESTNTVGNFIFNLPYMDSRQVGLIYEGSIVLSAVTSLENGGQQLLFYNIAGKEISEKLNLPPEIAKGVTNQGFYSITVKEGSDIWVNVFVENAYDEFGNYYEEWATISVNLEERVPV